MFVSWLRNFLLTVGVLIIPVVASAAALDDYYIAKFGSQLAATPVVTGVTITSSAAEPERCRTWLYHDLRRDWKQLEPQTQRILAKVLPARPVLTSEAIVLSSGGHFHIHYAKSGSNAPPLTDNNGNSIPDWVETVADVFEAVYNREVVVMGFKSPPTNGNQPYDVYLQNVGTALGEFGETDSDIFVTAVSATSYIVIDNDFSAAKFGDQITPYTPLKALQITAAHEFHHAIQYGYNFYFETWYAEATSTWMEDEVYDSVNQLYNYLPHYLQNTNLPLDTPVSVTTGGGYGRWIFNRYLAEIFPAPPYLIVRKIWEDLATKTSIGPDIPMLPVIDEVLKNNGSSLAAAFLGFNRRLFLQNWASHQNEISLVHPLTFSTQDTFTVTDIFAVPTLSLPSYSFNYMNILPSSSSTSLLINYMGKPANMAALAFLRTSMGVITEYVYSSGTISVPLFTSGAAAYLLISNNVMGATAVPAEPSQAVVTMPDATNPNSGAVTLITSGDGGGSSNSSSSGGKSGCFIATAAYGSYLHPKVVVLRQFRDRYLMTNSSGRALVAIYYRLSPSLAHFIARHESLRIASRLALTPVVYAVEYKGTAIISLLFLLFGAGGGYLLLRKPRPADGCDCR